MTLLLKFLRYNDILAPVISVFGNFLLIYLILTVKNMKQIGFVLIPNCVIDILLAVVTTAMSPLVFSKDQSFYVIVGGWFSSFGFTAGSIIMRSCSTIMITNVIAVCIPFYLRYLVICKHKKLTLKCIFQPYAVLLMISFVLFLLFSWSFPPLLELNELQKIATQTEFWLDEYPNGPAFVATKNDALSFLIPYSIILVITSVSFGMVIYYCIRIGKTLHTHMNQNAGSKILSKQFHKTLIIQAIGPVMVGNIPVATLIIMTFLKHENQNITLFFSFFLGWISVVNPIAAIIMITPYRKRIKEILGFKWKLPFKSTQIKIVSQTYVTV